jgi:DNA-binding response OmpR family regulator
MDMQMPVLDGIGATTAIRWAGVSPGKLPIVAVTANAYADDIRQCRAAGMQGHLAKPLRMKDLMKAIAQWTGTSQGGGGQPPAAAKAANTSPRLRKMFADRLTMTLKAIAAARDDETIDDAARAGIGSLLHQIAGTAAHFGAEELGRQCLETEKALLACKQEPEMRAMIDIIAEKIERESAALAA